MSNFILKLIFSLYSFTLPAVILLIMYFEQKQNTIRIGTTEIAAPGFMQEKNRRTTK